jgi:hypothetical protein
MSHATRTPRGVGKTQTMASPKTPGRNGYKYKEQYGVIVICKDAAHQERVYNRLRRLGLKLKVVVV